MRNVYYKTNFNLKYPVLDIRKADNYLKEDDMTKFLVKDLREYYKVAPEEVEKVEDIYWELKDSDSGSVVLTANDKLLPDTLDKISDWVSGQCSDGLGECFEQQPFASYDDPNGGYYDDDDNWVDSEYCMASFDWETNDYKFTQVANPRQELRESKTANGTHRVLRSDEFIKESMTSPFVETDDTKRLVFSKRNEMGVETDGIEWITDTYFATKDGCNGSIFDTEEDALRSVTDADGDNHQNAMDMVSTMMKDDELIDFVEEGGVERTEAEQMVENQDWNAVVNVIASKNGAEFFLSDYSGETYELENGKILYY